MTKPNLPWGRDGKPRVFPLISSSKTAGLQGIYILLAAWLFYAFFREK